MITVRLLSVLLCGLGCARLAGAVEPAQASFSSDVSRTIVDFDFGLLELDQAVSPAPFTIFNRDLPGMDVASMSLVNVSSLGVDNVLTLDLPSITNLAAGASVPAQLLLDPSTPGDHQVSYFLEFQSDGLPEQPNLLLAVAGFAIVSPPGDYDKNGYVELDDYLIWRSEFGQAGASQADGNGDGRVDAADYAFWRNHFPSAPAGAATAVPEPGACVVAALAAVLVLCGGGPLRLLAR